MHTFQSIVSKLSRFWEEQGALLFTPYDVEKGAGTSNPATFLRALGPEPFNVAYIEPCRRPKDGRYGTNPNRLQNYYQYQVILKPSPDNIIELYLKSLEAVGFDLSKHDIRFVHDDWENPSLGAWGLGWEVWIDGMECTQFTYFQAVGGIPLFPITGEITYGIERLAMYLQNVSSIFEIQWNEKITYGQLYKQNEIEWSHYNFEEADTTLWMNQFRGFQEEAKRLIAKSLPIPAYDFVIKASHAFNMLDARGVISVTERAAYIADIRELARLVAEGYLASRERAGYPLLGPLQTIHESAPIHSKAFAGTIKPQTFLLEIGCEELPATFVEIGRKGLELVFGQFLAKEELSYTSIRSYATPRRLAIVVEGLAPTKPGRVIEKKGPSITAAFSETGELSQAGLGFIKSLGNGIISQQSPSSITHAAVLNGLVEGIRIEKGYLIGTYTTQEKITADLLEDALPQLILKVEFPKRMKWGAYEITFARPIRWIVALFGDKKLQLTVGPIAADQISYGHRQLAPQPFRIAHADEYLSSLRARFVEVDQNARKASILSSLSKLEAAVLYKDRVLEEVVNLCEWPKITIGSYDPSFLRAPKEILALEMVEHQKYFPLADSSGNLLPEFVITANNTPSETIRQGNQRVLSARLSDGLFLWNEDCKTPLQAYADKTAQILYFKGLGTVADKVTRIKNALSSYPLLFPGLPFEMEVLQQVASLIKADLTTQVVGEFPELQGTIGKHLAAFQGYSQRVALAIEEHWFPRSETASVATSTEGALLAIADKLDTLVGFFGLGKKPSSSQDPFALRRQAIGILRTLLHHRWSVSISKLVDSAIATMPDAIKHLKDVEINLKDELIEFFVQRMRSYFIDFGFDKEEVEAVLSKEKDNPVDILARLEAIKSFRLEHKELFAQLLEVFKRSYGQLSTPEAKECAISPNDTLLMLQEEKALLTAYSMVLPHATQAFESQNYAAFLMEVAKLQPALAALFNNVKILTDDKAVRAARLSLLERIMGQFDRIADVRLLYGKNR